MSKQEKLAAFLEEFARWHVSNHSQKHVLKAWEQYQATPDDPPQPPEMPECVRWLVAAGEEIISKETVEYGRGKALLNAAVAVRDHYRQPLKLEVGKVYEDDAGEHVKVLWKNHNNHEFTAVNTKTDAIRYYDHRGVSSTVPHNLIREVANG